MLAYLNPNKHYKQIRTNQDTNYVQEHLEEFSMEFVQKRSASQYRNFIEQE